MFNPPDKLLLTLIALFQTYSCLSSVCSIIESNISYNRI